LIKAKELEGQLNTAKARNRLYRLTLQGANVSVPVANPDNP
jgi:hypothetical protein